MTGHPVRFYGQGPSHICSECHAPWHEECNACAAEWDHDCIYVRRAAEEALALERSLHEYAEKTAW